jgi:SAM-dependent methyltransferase
MKLLRESDETEIAALEARLFAFYQKGVNYPAFVETSGHPYLWDTVLAIAREKSGPGRMVRVLEVGAGRSGFGAYLIAKGREGIHYTAQDVTEANVDFLRGQADAVLTHSVTALEGNWDVIFSSYVVEHLCRPRVYVQALWDRLNPGGALVIQAPRYDIPFYLSPAFDHLTGWQRLGWRFRLVFEWVRDAFSSCPAFWIFSDPALFSLPFVRDRDAVHRVARRDLIKLLGGQADFSEFFIPTGSLKDYLVKRFLTLRLIARKR